MRLLRKATAGLSPTLQEWWRQWDPSVAVVEAGVGAAGFGVWNRGIAESRKQTRFMIQRCVLDSRALALIKYIKVWPWTNYDGFL
jgi:hypothetical protein